MNNLRNKVQLVGRLGKDPEVKKLENNNTLTKFSLATSDHYKNKDGEKVEDTQWHNIVVWGKLAEISEKFLKKGKEVMIEGKLVYKSYADKDGITKYSTEIIANDLLLMGKKEQE